jgi:hypothetical protein
VEWLTSLQTMVVSQRPLIFLLWLETQPEHFALRGAATSVTSLMTFDVLVHAWEYFSVGEVLPWI